MPQVEDKRGTGDEIDAEHTQLYRADTTPNKVRFIIEEPKRAGAAFGRTLASGLGIKDRLGETRSHKDRELKVNFIDKNNNHSGNKRPREQPIEEDEDGEWFFAEDGHDIDAQAADVGYSSMDEDQDVFAHSA